MENWFKFKPKKELREQVKATNKAIETEIAPTNQEDDVISLSLEEIKNKYPERYDAYLKVLRSEKAVENIRAEDLSELSGWISTLNNLDNYIEQHKGNKEERVLRDRQFTVFEDLRSSLEEGNKEGYIKLPTGTGKTVLFSQIIEALGQKTLIVVPSKLLVTQTGARLEEFTDLEYGHYYQDEKDFSKNVTIITYNSFIKKIEDGTIDPKNYGTLILDEARKSLGDKTVESVNKFNCIKIGFSATPEYSSKKKLSNLLEHQIHEMTISEAVKEGLINRFKSVFAYTEADLSGVDLEKDVYNQGQLEKAVNTRKRNLSAVKLYKELYEGKSTVAYCAGVKHATDLAKLFQENGISCEVISGSTSLADRKRILGDPETGTVGEFHSGKIKVLCNAKLLIEGFDEPKASVALNLHPTLSRVDAEQRAGRVLRLDKNDKEKWAYIVDFIDKGAKRPGITFPEIAQAAEITYKDDFSDIERRENESGENSKEEAGMDAHIDLEGLKVVVDTQEVYSLSKDISESREKDFKIPEGWLTASQITRELRVAHKTVTKFVEGYRAEHPEWFVDYVTGANMAEHYNPYLVNIIRKELSWEEPEEGWSTARQLSGLLKVHDTTIKKFVEKFRKEYPDRFKNFRTSGNLAEHYSPELVLIIKKELSFEKAPDGWKTAASLNGEGFSSFKIIKNTAEKYRLEYPEWFRDYKAGGVVAEHYDPRLVELIKKELTFEKAPDGWMSASGLVGSGLPVAYITVTKFIERYRKERPEWFKNFKSGSKISEYYHPELIKLIKKEFEIEKPMEGWTTPNQLLKIMPFGLEKIIIMANEHRQNHPEWFKTFKTGKHTAEHYSPELVEILASKKRDIAPPGWMSGSMIEEAGIASRPTAKKVAERYRIEKPEWFQDYYIGPKLTEHYSPEIVDVIRREFFVEKPPEGWFTASYFKDKIKGAPPGVVKFVEQYRSRHPEWFKTYKGRSMTAEHYSPELVKLIMNNMEKR